ncbi:MAG: hypothetical protein AAGB35_08625 [Pseudomonadota bacterium]
MSTRVAIELNDTGFIVSDGVHLIHNSPAYIIDSRNQTWLGNEARERAYLYSNECQNKFWSDIAHAENNTIDQAVIKLAMQHLASVWQQVPSDVTTVVLIVPATFTKMGLGYLLGICKQLDIPVRAMVHQAVLCPYQEGHNGDTLHLGVQLHNSAITKLETLDNEFAAKDVRVVSEVGIISLYTQCAEFIAQQFIEKTRLDPIYSAELEQQLHNSLPGWLQDSQRLDSVICRLEHQNNSFEIVIDSQQLHKVYQPLINNVLTTVKSICDVSEAILCIAESIDAQFGFKRNASKFNLKVRSLFDSYYAKQSFEFDEKELSYDGKVYLNKQLPYKKISDELTYVSSIEKTYYEPNHVLFCHYAYPINDKICLVRTNLGVLEFVDKPTDHSDIILIILKKSDGIYIEIDPQKTLKINDQLAHTIAKLSVGDSIEFESCQDLLNLIEVKR